MDARVNILPRLASDVEDWCAHLACDHFWRVFTAAQRTMWPERKSRGGRGAQRRAHGGLPKNPRDRTVGR